MGRRRSEERADQSSTQHHHHVHSELNHAHHFCDHPTLLHGPIGRRTRQAASSSLGDLQHHRFEDCSQHFSLAHCSHFLPRIIQHFCIRLSPGMGICMRQWPSVLELLCICKSHRWHSQSKLIQCQGTSYPPTTSQRSAASWHHRHLTVTHLHR